jgi:uncharacterized protein YrrD
MVSELIGLPIVSMDGGMKMGTVKDVLIDTDGLTATTLLISGDSGRGGLPFNKILAIGPDAVTVESAKPIFWASATKPGPGREAHEITGLLVVNISGSTLGYVRDIGLCGDHVDSLEVRSGGVLGVGANDTQISVKEIRSIGQKLVTVDVLTLQATA